jgi:NADPH:quinone reductase-like Zn-dependent oxidoreductase
MASNNTKYLVREKGGPLVATTTAKPTIIEPTEVMIRLKAIAINPADWKMIDQGHIITSWPFVPGLDGAGVVEAVGDDVKNFAVGDEVLALFWVGDRAASYQNFAVVQETKVARKPTTWSFEDAATLGCVVLFFFFFFFFFPFTFGHPFPYLSLLRDLFCGEFACVKTKGFLGYVT